MKKRFIIFLLILLILPQILAIEITLSKDSYQPGELLQAEITGNFITLNQDDIKLFLGDKVHQAPVIKDLTKQNNIYYFYAILPFNEGNFSLEIDTDYLERGKIINEPIRKDFQVISQNKSYLSITPGFITPNEDFSIKVTSLYRNTDITATFEATGESNDISLIADLEEQIKFSLPVLPPQTSNILIGDYNLPVFLIKKIDQLKVPASIEFIPHIISGIITENQEYHFTVLLKNTGENNLTNITFDSDLTTNIIPSQIDLIEVNQLEVINLTITVEKLDQINLNGKITAKSGDNTFSLPATFNITTNISEVKLKDATTISDKDQPLSCNKLGNLCQESEVCTGDTIESLDGPCCLGQCSITQTSNTSSYIGIILIIFLIGIISFAILKIVKRRKSKTKNTKQILSEKSDKFSQRMKGKEVRKNVDRV